MIMDNEENIRAAKREYHREWRKNHPEAVKAAQVKYWTKKAEEMRQAAANHVNTEER